VNIFLYRKYSFGKDESLLYSVQLYTEPTTTDTNNKQKGLELSPKKSEYDSPRYDADQKRYLLLESCSSDTSSEMVSPLEDIEATQLFSNNTKPSESSLR
jgi:hypothetical protein